MTFANSRAFTALLLILLATAGAWFYSGVLQRRLGKWISPELWKTVIPEFNRGVFFRKNLFLLLGLFFLALGMARPQWGAHEEIIDSQGMDILFLMDLSSSMLAEDTPPSRLSRSQNFIRNVLQNLSDDRAGIISFAEKAFLTAPLTNDFEYISEMAETLDPGAIASQGTNIGAAMETAIQAFERGGEDQHKQSRAVILITDGEDFGDGALAAAAKLKDFGAAFFAVSVGTAEGAPIPIRNESGVLQTYKKDSGQKTVLTRVNRALVEKIASAGGGTQVELINPEDAAYSVTKALRGMNRDAARSRMEVVKIDRFQGFFLLALLFLALHLSTGYRKSGVRFLPFLILLTALPARAVDLGTYLDSRKAEKKYEKKEFEDSAKIYSKARESSGGAPELSFNEGTSLVQSNHPEDGVGRLADSAKEALTRGDFETAARALYNEGLVHSKQKNMKESFDRLTKSIELAKRSGQGELEEAGRKALARVFQQQQQKQEQKQDSGQGQDQKKDQKKDQDQKPEDQKGEPRNNDSPKPEEDGRKRQFKGSGLSKDVAESIMNDLSDREKQLYQRRLGDRRPKEVPHDKDW